MRIYLKIVFKQMLLLMMGLCFVSLDLAVCGGGYLGCLIGRSTSKKDNECDSQNDKNQYRPKLNRFQAIANKNKGIIDYTRRHPWRMALGVCGVGIATTLSIYHRNKLANVARSSWKAMLSPFLRCSGLLSPQEKLERYIRSDNVKGVQEILCQDRSLLDVRYGKYGDTPLHVAAKFGKKPVVEKLVAAGADVLAKNNKSDIPLYSVYANDAQIGLFEDRSEIWEFLQKKRNSEEQRRWCGVLRKCWMNRAIQG